METRGHFTLRSLCLLGVFTPSMMWKNRDPQVLLSKFAVIIFHTDKKQKYSLFYCVRRYQHHAKAHNDLTATWQWLERNWRRKDEEDGNCNQVAPNYFVTAQEVLTGQAQSPTILFRGSICTNSALLDICTCRSPSVTEFKIVDFQPKCINTSQHMTF